ncbi:MAG: c-type cytochrome [Gammaproteobacteria bacterium]
MRAMSILLMSLAMSLAMGLNAAVAGVADGCMECHDPADSAGFAGEDVNELVEWIKEVRSGAVRHPQAGQADLSDEDIAAIAAELSGSG